MKSQKLNDCFKCLLFLVVMASMYYFLVIQSNWSSKQADICIRKIDTYFNAETNSIEKIDKPKYQLVLCGHQYRTSPNNELDTFISNSSFLAGQERKDIPNGLSVKVSCNKKDLEISQSRKLAFYSDGYMLIRDYNGDLCKIKRSIVGLIENYLKPDMDQYDLESFAENYSVFEFGHTK